jgi:hypothetical protein
MAKVLACAVLMSVEAGDCGASGISRQLSFAVH